MHWSQFKSIYTSCYFFFSGQDNVLRLLFSYNVHALKRNYKYLLHFFYRQKNVHAHDSKQAAGVLNIRKDTVSGRGQHCTLGVETATLMSM